MASETAAAHHEGHAEGSHASPRFYTMIGIILAVLTAMEVAAYYMDFGAFNWFEAPFLLFLSAVKFAIVVMFFMHLKFDSAIFTGLFVAGLGLAVFMISALVVLYGPLARP